MRSGFLVPVPVVRPNAGFYGIPSLKSSTALKVVTALSIGLTIRVLQYSTGRFHHPNNLTGWYYGHLGKSSFRTDALVQLNTNVKHNQRRTGVTL